MALEGEAAKINTELTKNAVEIRQIIQDFPLCSTFKEIDEQNGLVRGRLEGMRGNLSRLEVMARESLDLATSELVMTTVERHREQLTACQRQFRLANVKAMTALETQSSRDLFKSSGGDNPGLRQRRDKEQMVTEYSNVTDNLTAISSWPRQWRGASSLLATLRGRARPWRSWGTSTR